MKDPKNYIIAALVIALATSMLINLIRKPGDQFTLSPGSVSTSLHDAVKPTIAGRYTDREGREHTVIDRTTQQRISQEANAVAALIAPKIDSLAHGLSIRPKQIEGGFAVKITSASDSVSFLRRQIDSLRKQNYYYKDRYLELSVRIPAADDTLDKGIFDFRYDADILATDYFKREKIIGMRIGRKKYYTDITSSDPRMKIRGMDRFTIPRKVPAMGLRLQALTAYSLARQEFSAGLGVRVDIGDDFNAGLNYTYNFGTRQWAPLLYTKYDLLQFGR